MPARIGLALFVLAAFLLAARLAQAALVLHQPNGSVDVCPGSPLAGRPDAGCTHLVSYCCFGSSDAGVWVCDRDGGCTTLDAGQ